MDRTIGILLLRMLEIFHRRYLLHNDFDDISLQQIVRDVKETS
jgi:hypothetical protein